MGRRLLTTAAALIAAGIARGDQLRLADGGRLSGEIVSMAADGSLTMHADVAVDPLEILPEQIRRVDFSKSSPTVADHDARVQLINGDVLPCDLIAIDAEDIKVRTTFAGDLTFSREVVDRMQLGIRPHRLILAGIGNEDDWVRSDGDWSISNDALVSADTGHVGRAVKQLPSSFSLSFRLKWSQRPAFKVFFCSDPDKGSGGQLDRYYLQFNTAGFELKRQSTGQTSYHALGVVNRGPESFANRSVDIEVRVDRPSRMLYLYLDGELEGRFPDQLDDVPEANGIVFESGTKADEGHVVSRIEVRQWDASGDRHKSEDRGDAKSDAVIDHDGQRFGGSLLETAIGKLEVTKGDKVVLFQSPHLDDPMEIPVNGISTIFFAGTNGKADTSPLYFGLGGGGQLSAASGRFDQQHIFLEHPLLGRLTIDRAAIASLDRRKTGTTDDKEEP